MRTVVLIAIVALGVGVACTPPEERAEEAREAIRQGLERGDRSAALDAVEDLRESLPDTADSLLEVAQLLGAPDQIGRHENELWFVYRFTEDRLERLAFKLVVTIFERKETTQTDTRLLVAFDTHDRLLYHATVEGEDTGLLGAR